MSSDSIISFDRDRWTRALEDIAVALGKDGDPVEICLIGSATCLLGGMEGRTSVDLDIWMPDSKFLIDQVIQTLPPADRDIASENLVYLDILK